MKIQKIGDPPSESPVDAYEGYACYIGHENGTSGFIVVAKDKEEAVRIAGFLSPTVTLKATMCRRVWVTPPNPVTGQVK